MLNAPPDKILVPPTGPLDCEIAFVGEAPGTEEAKAREPFVGRSGNLLNSLLQIAGITRSQCYFTNVVKEQPPKTSTKTNDISVFVDLSKKNPMETDAYKKYVEELKEELSECKANIFVALGNVPLYALTGIHPPKITSRRGSVYESTLVPGKKVLACIHPAACIHGGGKGGNYIYQHYIVFDLRKAVEQSKFPEYKPPQRTLITDPSFAEVMNFLKKSKESGHAGFDIEVDMTTLEISHISFAPTWDLAISIPFFQKGREYFPDYQEAEIWHEIAGILSDPEVIKYGQNLVFDKQFIFRRYGIITRNLEDTMVAQGVLYPDLPKGLDFICSIYTDEPYYKDDGKFHTKRSLPPAIVFQEYNAKDSAVCVEAFPKIIKQLDKMGNLETYERQRNLIEILVYMSERGIRMDVEGLRKASVTALDRENVLKEQLNDLCGYEINPNSVKQLKEYFYGKKGIKPYIKRGTKSVTTDETALKRIARKGYEEARIILEIRGLVKLRGTYYDVKLDPDGRIRSAYNPVGAADTGRLNSRISIWGTGTNLQNDPPEFRRFLTADKGYLAYNIDLSQAENRIVAYIAPEPSLIEVFEEGLDPHRRTAGMIFNLPEEEVSDEPHSAPDIGTGRLSQRYWGKTANHAFDYDFGYKGFALKYDISEQEGRRIRTAFHKAYPGISGNYWNWIRTKLSKDRTLVNLFGRNRRFMDRWGDGLFKEAYAFIPQSTVADKINEQGLIHVYYDQSTYKHVELLNQVHDSIEFQVPVSIGWREHARILKSIKRSLEAPLFWRASEFVIPAEGKAGLRFSEFKSINIGADIETLAKELETLYDSLEQVWE